MHGQKKSSENYVRCVGSHMTLKVYKIYTKIIGVLTGDWVQIVYTE